MITILSIDGGGIRGVIPIMLLEEIEKKTGKPVSGLFDYIAGTSTGGIITAMLTVPDGSGVPRYTAGDVKKLYVQLGGSVFHRNALRKMVTLCGMTGPKYSARPLERYLNRYLSGMKLHETVTKVLITAYEMESGTPWFFKTAHAVRPEAEIDDPMLAEAARATSAAPTYFSPCRINGKGCFTDGGIFANNPALCAYAEAQKHTPFERDFLIVSLGTGERKVQYSFRKAKHWGTMQWSMPLLNMVPNSACATVDYQMKTIVGPERYWRFQVRLDENTAGMDDASLENIARIELLAKKEIENNRERLNRLCRILLENSRENTKKVPYGRYRGDVV